MSDFRGIDAGVVRVTLPRGYDVYIRWRCLASSDECARMAARTRLSPRCSKNHAFCIDGTVSSGPIHEVVSNIERIGDHAENIAEYTLDCKMNDSKFSKDALDDLWDIAEHAKQAYSVAIKVIKGEGHEEEERRLCWENEDMVDKLRDEMKEKHIRRLAKGECDPRSGMIYTDMVVDLERIADHATNLVGDISGEPKMIAN